MANIGTRADVKPCKEFPCLIIEQMAPYKNHFNIKQIIQVYEKFCHKSVIENTKIPIQKDYKILYKTVTFYKGFFKQFRVYVKSRDVNLKFFINF